MHDHFSIKKLIRSSVVLLSLFSACGLFAAKSPYDYLYKNLAFAMPRVSLPVFPDNRVSVADFGGAGDGVTLNTEAFRMAVEGLSRKGGGHLVVPPGVWFTGPIVLKSNIDLHLEKGALLLFSPNFSLYPLVATNFEGLDTKRCQSPISARSAVNVAITGMGSINGSGEAWRPLKKAKVTEAYWKKVIASGGVLKDPGYWFPSQMSLKGESLSDMNVPKGNLTDEQFMDIRDFLRPVMISFIACKNVFLQGVLFENSPAWNIHPFMCENVIIDNILVRNPAYAQNGDGIDIESCKNVLLVNSTFDVGDDAICIKSGKDEQGRKRAVPTQNLLVDNCKVFKGHGGFVVGSEMSGGVRNVKVSNCQFLGTDVGLRFKSNRGRGGVVENIYIDHIFMFDIATDSFLFDLFYNGKSASESLEDGDAKVATPLYPVSEKTPVFRNIFISNVVSRNAWRAMYFNGLPEMNISNIHVEDTYISSTFGAELCESDGIKFKNIHISPQNGTAISLRAVKNFELSQFYFPVGLKPVVKVSADCFNIQLPAGINP